MLLSSRRKVEFGDLATWIFLQILVGSIGVQSQAQPREYYAILGESLNLEIIVEYGKAIQFCRWDAANNINIGPTGITFFDEETMKTNTTFTLYDKNKPNPPGYSYFGTGLYNGTCGIRIENVTDLDITNWTCIYLEYSKIDREPSPEPMQQHFLLTKSVAPDAPEILQAVREAASSLIDTEDSTKGTKNVLDVECCAKDGIPHPTLSIQLDDDEVESTINNCVGSCTSICISAKDLYFTRKDNGKNIKCIAYHKKTDSTKEDVVPLVVYYPPKILSGTELHVSSLEPHSFKINYESNPIPKITLQVMNENGIFQEITTGVKTVEKNHNDTSNELIVTTSPMSMNHTTTIYRLSLKNPYGSSRDVYFEHKHYSPPGPGEPGFELFWLLYPLIGFIAIVILATLVYYCVKRNKHRRGRYHTTETSAAFHGEL